MFELGLGSGFGFGFDFCAGAGAEVAYGRRINLPVIGLLWRSGVRAGMGVESKVEYRLVVSWLFLVPETKDEILGM